MTYVPVPIIVPEDSPSPKTRELAGLLTRVIAEYETHHPSVTPGEIRSALHLAAQSGGRGAAPKGLLVALLGGLMVFAGLAVFYLSSSGAEPVEVPTVAFIIGVFAITAVLIAVKKSRM